MKALRHHLPLRVAVAAIICLVASALQAQHGLITVSHRPDVPKNDTWYFVEEESALLHYTLNRWYEQLWSGMESAYLRDSLVIGRLEVQAQLYRREDEPRGLFTEVVCGSRLAMAPGHGDVLFYDLNRSIFATVDEECGAPTLQPQVVAGKHAYCARLYDQRLEFTYCTDVHTWGILTLDGEWLIAPIFDHPFRFVDGVAEVEYYGKLLRIDEKGGMAK